LGQAVRDIIDLSVSRLLSDNHEAH